MFGNQRAVLTFKKGQREHSVALTPAKTGVALGLCGILMIGSLVSGAYMMLRDDLMGAALARHASMQHAYEDRITALRAQVDIVTSRQMLDQQAVEERVSQLMARQNEIGARQGDVHKVLNRAVQLNALPVTQVPALQVQPASKNEVPSSASGLRLGSLVGSSSPFVEGVARASAFAQLQTPDDTMFDSLELSLEATERAQFAELEEARKVAEAKAQKLAAILTKQGIRVPESSSIGGPLIELKSPNAFAEQVDALDASLEMLEQMRRVAHNLPHGSPTPGQKISSYYGSRKDPFTGRRAMHAGLDFRARSGTPVLSTASGKVVKAGRSGGYGKLVEIDHGTGITTRYAHLKRIHVKVGQKIERGAKIGAVGSTGRSTGPHLHYEVRRKGRVLDPIHYVRLEKHLRPYL